MPSYKLIYFESRGGAELSRLVFAAAGVDYIDERIPRDGWPSKKPGGAELSRLVFAAAGVDYIDERIPRDGWPSKKPDQPLKALPVLEVDGKKYCQGAAIARYLAREFGLMGKNNLEALRIDELHEAISELFQSLVKIYYEQDKDKKEELLKTVTAETLPKFCTFFEMRLCENDGGNGFFVGKELTLGDILLYNLVFMLRHFLQKGGNPDPFEKFEKLKALYNRVDQVPKIAEWVKKRPVTEN